MKETNDIQKLKLEVMQWIRDNPDGGGIMGDPIPNRSCWECNSGHENLKHDIDYPFKCYDCGEIYYKGVKLEF